MAYIMPLFLGLFVILIHAVFYYHDKAVINGAAAETAVLGAQADRNAIADYDLEGFFYDRTKGTQYQGQAFPEFMQKIIAAEGLINYINSRDKE